MLFEDSPVRVSVNVLATPHPIRAGEVVPSSRYIYYETAPGQPKALRTWFARDTSNGQDIIGRVAGSAEKETDGVTLIFTRHRPPAIPIAPLHSEPLLRGRLLGKGR